MQKYRKKPVEIEAMEFKGTSVRTIFTHTDHVEKFDAWLADKVRAFNKANPTRKITGRYKGGVVIIGTLEGEMIADPGDFIICGVQGELYPCKPDIFAATYDIVE